LGKPSGIASRVMNIDDKMIRQRVA